ACQARSSRVVSGSSGSTPNKTLSRTDEENNVVSSNAKAVSLRRSPRSMSWTETPSMVMDTPVISKMRGTSCNSVALSFDEEQMHALINIPNIVFYPVYQNRSFLLQRVSPSRFYASHQ